ncbi:thioredoxin family protein [Massilia psychrophila]|jgi:thiol-disulfide isomerase/thioredoxin|uniref:Thiol reductase thioredoxin n=1 Tax=Massilia psychrophila TaxID=1603353 RepID=A0A2G8SWB4_9BURK|nr:thioredoxin family protein [Massilia psychrophila]PIL38085.1 thiol reductase thioredoxin [Massilia psychrophila]GGE88077.1 thioredoxin [Massilia psychrophila]
MFQLKTILFTLATLVGASAYAGDVKPYNQAQFDGLVTSGKPVVIAVHAPWCGTCKTQMPMQADLMKKPEYKDVTLMTVDFDSQKDVLKKFNVTSQSTMVVFKAAKEVARSVGDTNLTSMDASIRKAL